MTPWGITIQTDTHGEDVDAAAADDDYAGDYEDEVDQNQNYVQP